MRYKWGQVLLLTFLPWLISIPLQITSGYYLVVNVGVLAYVLLLCDAIIGLRPRWIEKWIDLQNLYMAHGIIALFIIILSLWHLVVGKVDGLSKTLGNIAFYGMLLLCIFAIVFLTSQIQRFCPFLNGPITKVKKIANRYHFTREVNDWLHILFPVFILLVFFHVVTISYIRQYASFYQMFLIYSVIFAIIYLYEGVIKKFQITKYTVEKVEAQPNNSYEVVMTYHSGRRLNIRGGQFIFIATKHTKMAEYHPFSVLAVEEKGNIVRLGIRIAGDFTKQFAQAQKGEIVKVRGVYGHFVVKDATTPTVAIGGGIGITPCISLLQSLPQESEGLLIWSRKDHCDDHMFTEEVTRLTQSHPNIKIIYHYACESGFLNEKSIAKYTNQYKVDEPYWYMCGPIPMMNDVSKELTHLGVPSKKLITEGFIF